MWWSWAVVVSLLFPQILQISGFVTSNQAWKMTKLSEVLVRRRFELDSSRKTNKNGKKGDENDPKAPAAARVSNQLTSRTGNAISVKRQIEYVKAHKRFLASYGKESRVHTAKVKKSRSPKPEKEDYVEIDYENTAPPAVFVDGYNIIGYINTVEKRSIGLDDARDCLISDLCVLASTTGWYIECVFDAYNNPMGGTVQNIDSIKVVYTSQKETADSYIERKFSELGEQGVRNIVVATNDNALRMVAQGALGEGIGYISAENLVEELRIAYGGWGIVEQELASTSRQFRPNIGDSLSPELKMAINQMKMKSQKEKKGGAKDNHHQQTSIPNPSEKGISRKKQKQKTVAITADNMADILAQMEMEMD